LEYPKKKLIQMRLDLEEISTNKIDGFKERIETMLPH
jgi:cyanophycin synthetase